MSWNSTSGRRCPATFAPSSNTRRSPITTTRAASRTSSQRDDLGGELRADAGGVAHGERNDGFLHFDSFREPSARRGIQVVMAGT